MKNSSVYDLATQQILALVTANERGGISRENNASIDYQSGAPTLNMTHLI